MKCKANGLIKRKAMTTEAARGGKQPKKQTRKQERGLKGGERTRNEKWRIANKNKKSECTSRVWNEKIFLVATQNFSIFTFKVEPTQR